MKPLIEPLLIDLTLEEAKLKEIEFITKFRDDGHNLTNISPGGGLLSEESLKKLSISLKGRVQTEEHRRKNGDAKRGRKLTFEHRQKLSEGQKKRSPPTQETKRKQSESLKKVVKTQEWKENLSKANTGKRATDEHKKKLSEAHNHEKIKVVQYDKEGNFIRKYNSIKETQEYGFNIGHVAACIRGVEKHHKGFIWKKFTDEIK